MLKLEPKLGPGTCAFLSKCPKVCTLLCYVCWQMRECLLWPLSATQYLCGAVRSPLRHKNLCFFWGGVIICASCKGKSAMWNSIVPSQCCTLKHSFDREMTGLRGNTVTDLPKAKNNTWNSFFYFHCHFSLMTCNVYIYNCTWNKLEACSLFMWAY